MSAPAVGIDLGTTYSCVAVYRNGKVEIIPNEEGNRITPSYVAFTDTERLIGDAAKNQDAMNPTNTIFDAKRLIGRRFDDPIIQDDIKHWPFEVINDNGKPKIKIQDKGVQKTFFPEEVSSMVLNKMKGIAETYLGKPVKNAVVTVPAYFTDSQKKATKNAGAIAGLNVLRLLNEPTAGALAYGLGSDSEDLQTVLIFDLGGGTFDVSILTIEEEIFEVKAVTGDTHLGGEDFDNRMVRHFVEEFKRKHGMDLSTSKKAIRRLRTACEKAKRTLSTSTQAAIDLECLFEGVDFHGLMTRPRFEKLNEDLFKSTIEYVKKALEDANLKVCDIDEIILVGGSTRIPMVQRLLSDFFEGKNLNKSVNPDEAVAYGAAIQAAHLDGDLSEELQDLILADVTPLSLGINLQCGIMSTVIKRNTRIPVKITAPFSTASDNQAEILFQVFEGERGLTKDNNLLGKFTLDGIPLAQRGVPKIDVTFEIDENGILNVSAVEKTTKTFNSITINNNTAGRLTKEDVDRMVEEAERYRQEDEKNKEMVKAKIKLEYYCYSTMSKLESGAVGRNRISRPNKLGILKKINDTLNWLDLNPSAGREEYDRRLQDLTNIMSNSSISR